MRQLLPAFLEDVVADADADGVVVALDGDVDTTVTAALAVEGLGSDRVTALVMPARLGDEAAARQAEAVASMLDVTYRRFPLQSLLGAFQETVGTSGEPTDDPVAVENALDRLRMTCAYYVANASDAVVAGATDRTTRLLGPVTKYGDTGVDCLPLGDLYRTEVDTLARHLDVPEEIRNRSARRLGATDDPADRLDVDPATVDRVLHLLVDERLDPSTVVDRLGVDPTVVERIDSWCEATRHKRHPPTRPSTSL